MVPYRRTEQITLPLLRFYRGGNVSFRGKQTSNRFDETNDTFVLVMLPDKVPKSDTRRTFSVGGTSVVCRTHRVERVSTRRVISVVNWGTGTGNG